MPTEIEYALLAGTSYYDTRTELNRFPLPKDWSYVSRLPQDTSSGFEASTFRNGDNFVISFAGTYDMSLGDLQADVGLATGFGSVQLQQAADYYLRIRKAYPEASITLTGHSLGGGLAALIGVFFGVNTIAFDQAPFAGSAMSGQPDVAAQLKTDLLAMGYTADDLAGLSNFLQLRQTNGGIPNSARVTNYRVDGEFLSGILPFSALNTVGLPAIVLTHGTTDASGFDLHAQSLLAAFLLTEQNGNIKSLRQATNKLTDLLDLMFDSDLYAFRTDKTDENFLERLVRHEVGNAPGATTADAMLTRFTSDLWQLARDGGLTTNDGNPGNADLRQVSNALIAFAMQFYCESTANAQDKTKTLFTDLGDGNNGIRFDIADVSPDIRQAADQNAALDLNQAKGFKQYFADYLKTTAFSDDERAFLAPLLPYLRDWYVQAGAGGMMATDEQNRGAFMLGGSTADTLTGGEAADLLLGNGGDDRLQGGKGNDTLLGGEGNDTYAFAKGDGLDTVYDRDGFGLIEVDGEQAAGGAQYGDKRVYKDDNKHVYVQVDNQTLIIDGRVVIKGVDIVIQPQTLGMSMTGPTSAPEIAIVNNIHGDVKPFDLFPNEEGIQASYLENRDKFFNPLGYADPFRDYLRGSSQNDHMTSGEFDDNVKGGGGDDWLEGGNGNDFLAGDAVESWEQKPVGGNDILEGGTGSDLLFGEDGNDRLYGETRVTVAAAIEAGNKSQGTGLSGDWLSGGDGDDQLVTGTGNDILSGGRGDDLIVAGAGDDTIWGDAVCYPLNYGAVEKEVLYQYVSSRYTPVQVAQEIHALDQSQFTQWGFSTDENGTRRVPMSDFFPHLDDGGNDVIYSGAGNDAVDAGSGNDVVFGEGDDDFIDGGSGNDVLVGGDGQDRLNGGEDEDYLDGGAQDDQLYGGDGDDILVGGAGNDYLVGGAGRDTYAYNFGDGIDTIVDNAGSSNILKFGQGLSPSNLTLRRGSLLLDFGEGNAIHLENFDANDASQSCAIDTFVFADGTVLSKDELLARGFDLVGTSENDRIEGTNLSDRISGGTGNDQLLGGAGDDVYIINLGDGQDAIIDRVGNNTVRFGEGIAKESLQILHGGYYDFDQRTYIETSRIGYGTQGDAVVVQQGLLGAIERFEFADGSTMTWAEAMANYPALNIFGSADDDRITGTGHNDSLYGNAGNDTIAGQAGDDTLYGGAGNDTLAGQAGNDLLDGGEGDDSYIFNPGDGFDTLQETSGIDTVIFGSGLNLADMQVSVVHSLDGKTRLNFSFGSDTLSVIDGHLGSIETFRFADGTSLDRAALLAGQDGLTLDGSEQADVIFGSNGNDTLRGQGDDDTLQGQDGNDVLLGGNGNDVLHGGTGDDDLLGQNGDDTLNGGAGHDTYHLAFGIGHDTVHELAGETSLIRLGAGLQASDFLARLEGNDLTLNIAGTDDKLTLTDYFSNTASWQIETNEGQQSLADFLATASTPPSQAGSVYEQARSIFTREVERTYLSNLAAEGYQLEADNLYHRYSYSIDRYSSSASHYIDEGVVRKVTESDSSWIVVPGSSWEQVSYNSSSVQVSVVTNTLTSAGAAASQTSSAYFVPSGVYSGLYVPLGSGVVEVEDSTGRYLGSWVYPPEHLSGDQSGTITNFYETTSTARYRYSLEELVAGNSDNQIVVGYGSSNPAMLDAGAGNDTIEGSGLLYGNSGNDQLTGADGNDILIGGEGADTLDGGEGADRYFLENEAPLDLIVDRGETYRIASQTGGEYSGWPGLFPTLASALDEVIFPNAVSPADLSFSWNDEVVSWPERFYNGMGAGVSEPLVSSLTAVLTINWGNGYGVRIAMPHSDQVAGGIERFTFADGTSLTRDQILALAPTHDLDPQLGDNILVGSGNLAGLAGNDVISGASGNDFLDGGDGNDHLIGGDGNDRLNGGRGADLLSGGAGNDTLGSGGFENSSFGIGGMEFWGEGNTYQGGTGDDTLLGTVNADTYLFDVGDGQDTISDYYHDHGGIWGNYMDVAYGGPAYFAEAGAPADDITGPPFLFSAKPYVAKDVLRFGAGVQSSDVTVVREGYDLLLVYSGEGDSIRLSNWYEDIPHQIARLEFADGTVWDKTRLGDFEGQLIIGSDQADALMGTELDDTISGLAGDDVLSGSGGYDIYRFDQGDGHDVIVENGLETSGTGFGGDVLFGGNILPEHIQALRHDQDLVLANVNGTDSVTVRDWFSDPNLIKMVRFADGTQWTTEVLQELVAQNPMEIHGTSGDDLLLSGAGNDQLYGLAGNDTLQGGDGDDLLSGGAGNDHLYGGNGSDTFVFNIGDGVDVLEDFGVGGDLVTFGAGISPDDLSFANENGDLVILRAGSSDSLSLKAWFDGNVKLGQLSFADGTTLDAEEMTRRATAIVEPPTVIVPTAGADDLRGGSASEVIDAGAGDDRVDGGAGNDTLRGGEGNDTLLGGAGDDLLYGDGGNNILDGGAGNDVLQGSWGNDTMQGGMGDDVLYAGGGAYNVLDGGEGSDQLIGDWGDEVISGGSGDNIIRAGGGHNTITAGDGHDVIFADWGNDTIDAGNGHNQISAGGGDNRIVSGAGDDTISTSWGADFVSAGAGNDIITSTSGNDILLGGDGNDSISGADGSNLLDGGAGADVLSGGWGSEVFIGGAGNDSMTLVGGNDIVLFNKNDGQDTVVTGPWASETLSLGGGISYNDLAFVKEGNDLQLKVGGDDQITFKDWYAAPANKAVANLQVIAEAMADFAPGGNDPLRNQKVEQFNFKGLVGAFDAALAQNSTLSSWALTNALTSFQLAGADTAALGGDLAYQYGKSGSLSGIGLTAGQQLLGSWQLGTGAQSLQAPTTLQEGAVRLG